MKKLPYITPECDMIGLSPEQEYLLTLSVSNEETEIVGANEHEFDEDEAITPPSSLWDKD